MIWFTSDLHFNHLNILKYEPKSRPFENVAEMNEALIKNWNDRVKPEDTVFVLGDNRNNSHDSRDSDVGAVPVKNIIGKAQIRLLPVSTFGSLYK